MTMTHLTHRGVFCTLMHLVETSFARVSRRLMSVGHGRRQWPRKDVPASTHQQQQHFGSLDDQLLQDIGLQRSKIRAAEYGMLPGDQALHHGEGDQAGDKKEVRRQSRT